MSKLQVVFVLKADNGKTKEFTDYPKEKDIHGSLIAMEANMGYIEKEYRLKKEEVPSIASIMEDALADWYSKNPPPRKPTAFVVTSEAEDLLKAQTPIQAVYPKIPGAKRVLQYLAIDVLVVDKAGIGVYVI